MSTFCILTSSNRAGNRSKNIVYCSLGVSPVLRSKSTGNLLDRIESRVTCSHAVYTKEFLRKLEVITNFAISFVSITNGKSKEGSVASTSPHIFITFCHLNPPDLGTRTNSVPVQRVNTLETTSSFLFPFNFWLMGCWYPLPNKSSSTVLFFISPS